ncbi:glycosyltransferase [Arcobacter vandammei]|uniref:glycosyltransferase n=1 Tax=Arcobacter vandammei TaxID=2782243 RepID=UPI0018DEF286|nr:glycosyltransferase [Arcobacter vandammei]
MKKDIKCTIIVSVYKDTDSLDLILESLSKQTMIPNEVIVSEDCESGEMRNYVQIAREKYKNLDITHLFQKDDGWRKNKALNRAISSSKYEYLIFIDGDCVPYDNFIEWHLKLASQNNVLCGRRSEPGEYISNKIRDRNITVENYRKNYLKLFFEYKNDKDSKHYDAGIFINPKSLFGKILKNKRDKNSHIVGCNFSCFKVDLEKINGFDEDFIMPTTGEDTDIERRMRICGIEMKSCRNAAIIVHLYHQKVFNDEISRQTLELMNSKGNEYICKKGLVKYE